MTQRNTTRKSENNYENINILNESLHEYTVSASHDLVYSKILNYITIYHNIKQVQKSQV